MELAYGLGLRAADPTIRAKFYALWNKAIPATLFERLRHVIMGQNWEEMGDTFWLKQAVVSISVALDCTYLGPWGDYSVTYTALHLVTQPWSESGMPFNVMHYRTPILGGAT